MKTAARNAALTVPVWSTVRPRTNDSGIPSEDDAEDDGERDAVRLPARHGLALGAARTSISQSPGKNAPLPANKPAARLPVAARAPRERLLDELERDRADQHAGAEGHDRGRAAASRIGA